jgi:hypothetical protein
MPNDHARPSYLLDKPTSESVGLLVRALHLSHVTRSISPKNHAHRSRVIRQQTELLALEAYAKDEATKHRAKQMRKASRAPDHRDEGGQG